MTVDFIVDRFSVCRCCYLGISINAGVIKPIQQNGYHTSIKLEKKKRKENWGYQCRTYAIIVEEETVQFCQLGMWRSIWEGGSVGNQTN